VRENFEPQRANNKKNITAAILIIKAAFEKFFICVRMTFQDERKNYEK
jgi:hypothetical protein